MTSNLFSEEIVTQVMDSWIFDQNHPGKGRYKKPVPTQNDFRAMLENAFLASMLKEEGRQNTFSLVLLSSNDRTSIYDSLGKRQEIILFHEDIELSAENIAKISSATNPKFSALLVGHSQEIRENYVIWGIMYYGMLQDRFHSIPAALSDFPIIRPDLLTVIANDVGTLLICRGSHVLGSFVNGSFHPSVPSSFISHSMGKYLIKFIENNNGFKSHKNEYWHIYRDSLLYFLLNISKLKKGGTVILVPEGSILSVRRDIKEKFAVGNSLNIENLFNKLLNTFGHHESNFFLKYLDELSQRLRFLGQLASIDGALLISNYIDPISFGATLLCDNYTGKLEPGPDGAGTVDYRFNFSRFGTRHNSALSFIGAHPDCIGFVISEDGFIRGIAAKGDTVYFWYDCFQSVFLSEMF